MGLSFSVNLSILHFIICQIDTGWLPSVALGNSCFLLHRQVLIVYLSSNTKQKMWVSLCLEPLQSCTCPKHITVAKGKELSKLACKKTKLTLELRVRSSLFQSPGFYNGGVVERKRGGQSQCLLQSSSLNVQHCDTPSLVYSFFRKCPNKILVKRESRTFSSDDIQFQGQDIWVICSPFQSDCDAVLRDPVGYG